MRPHDASAEAALRLALDEGRTEHDFGDIAATKVRETEWADRCVSATIVMELIRKAKDLLQPFRLVGACVLGSVSLASASIKVPIRFRACHITGGVDLDSADLSQTELRGCLIGNLSTRFAVTGRFAKIAGELDVTGSTLGGPYLAWMLDINQVFSWTMAGVLVAAIGGLLKRT